MRANRSANPAMLVLVVVLFGASGIGAAQSGTKGVPPPSGPYRIAGTVVNAKTGAPLAGATVQIHSGNDAQNARGMTASSDGRFEFHVMAGKFSLRGAQHGFITSYYNARERYTSAVVTGAGLDTEHLILRLPPDAVLAGKVLDENGDPVRGAEVGIYREDRSSGISHVVSAETTTTDDQGIYEATPLAEGTYFVGVHTTPWYAVHPLTGRASAVDRSLDVAYPVTYYGDVTQSEEATPIPVRGGDRLEADIHLTPVPAVHLTFHADNEQSSRVEVVEPIFNESGQAPGYDVEMVSPGLYEMTGLAPGKYVLRMTDASGELKEPAEMELSGELALDSLSTRSVSEIKITAQMRDGSKLPEQLSFALRSPKSSRQLAWERVNEGQATISDVVPGGYDLLAATSDRGYEVTQISSGENHSSGKTLDVPAGSSLEITAVIVGGMAKVDGLAKRGGKPVAGAMIVLVPEDPEANRELFRRDESDLDGTFSLLNAVPGSYTVIAIDDGWDLDWATPAVLARFLPKGGRVKVGDQIQGTIHLPAPVEVQKK